MVNKEERTLTIVKPDGVQRGLIGEILKRYEQTGLKLIGAKLTVPTEAQVVSHYLVDPDWKRKVGEKTMKSYQAKGLVPPESDPEKIGELHKWMYDSASLSYLLKSCGFADINKTDWNVSKITGWVKYSFDESRDKNKPRKPDSFYMEAKKLI